MNRIKELRKLNKITQTKLAKKIGIAQPTLSGYETNSFEPDFQTAAKIADFFDVSLDYLLGREEQEKKPIEDFPISFKNFEDGLYKRGIFEEDIKKLTPEQTKALFDTFEQLIKAFKSNK